MHEDKREAYFTDLSPELRPFKFKIMTTSVQENQSERTLNNVLLKFISIVVCLFLINYSNAQSYIMDDVIYLKNGSVIRGSIIEQIPNVSIKIETKDRNLFVFRYDEIEKFSKESNIRNNRISTIDQKSKGNFFHLTEISMGPGVGRISLDNFLNIKNEDFALGIKIVNGVHVNNQFSIGIGLGFDKYEFGNLIPITLDMRGNILKSKTSPVIALNIGYSVGINENKGGVLVEPRIGVKSALTEDSFYFLNIGYKLQSRYFSSYSTFDPVNINKSAFAKYLNLAVGIGF